MSFWYGTGRNGKSTILDIWSRVLGDYAATIPIERFLRNGAHRDAGAPSPDLARLRGVRLVRTSEPERGAKLAESLIKLMTSGEPMPVRNLNCPFFDMRPQFKAIMSGNYIPAIAGTDDGIWRRIVLVDWKVQLRKEDVDLDLGKKLLAEGSGILNRIVQGTLDWLSNGLQIPQQIEQATTEYREASDVLGRFLAECARPAPGLRVQATDIYLLFVAWARATGGPVWKQHGFANAMRDRGHRVIKASSNFYLDLELTKSLADYGVLTEERGPAAEQDKPSDDHDDVPL